MNISDAAIKARPGAELTCGETYESLVMLDGSSKPTMLELEAAWNQVLDDRATQAASDSDIKSKLQQAEALLVKLDDGTATQAEVKKGLAAVIRVIIRHVLKTN